MTTTTRNTENLDTRNRRYKYAKESADTVNKLFAQFAQLVGKELTADQVRNLLSLAHEFSYANDSAGRKWELYSDFCDSHNYKMRDITFMYPYAN